MTHVPTFQLQSVLLHKVLLRQDSVRVHELVQHASKRRLPRAWVASNDQVQALLQHLMVTSGFNILNLLPNLREHLLRLSHSDHARHLRINVLLLFLISWLHANPKVLFHHRKLVHVANRLAALCRLLKYLVNALRSAP